MDNNTPDTQLTPNESPANSQDSNVPAAQQLSPNSDFVNETSKPKKSRLFIILIACIVILLIVGTAWYTHHRSSLAASNATSITVANEKIPPASCMTAQKLIKQSVDGDECYVARFKVGTEPIQYVAIRQSEAYQQKQSRECQLDCGGSIPITRSDYIVRANGKVQYTLPDWTEPAEPDIDELTGCGDGNFGILKSQSGTASFVQDNGDIGLYVTAQGVNFPDQFGDNCAVAFKLTQDITNNQSPTTGLSIAQLSVHYGLKPMSGCQQQSGSSIYECYQDQAIMRNDLSLCNMTVDPTDPNDGDETCVSGLAYRRQDPTLCSEINNAWRKNCQTTSQQLSDVLRQKLIVD